MQLPKKELQEVVVDKEKEYGVSESMKEAPLNSSLIFPLPLKESDLPLLISYVNQSFDNIRYYEGVGWI